MDFDPGYLTAATAGILSFLSPCILPIVPFYLSYMAGLSMQELTEDNQIARGAKLRLILSSVFFAAGVITIFVLLGLGATAAGQALGQYKEPLSYVAAAILIVFGLHFLGVVKIPFLYREAKIDSTSVKPASYVGSYLIGLAFGFGWTPCVGPALSLILFIAMDQDSLLKGGMLLFVYGAAMTFPFIIVSFFSGPFLSWVKRHRAMMGYVEKVMGAFLILFALLIVTGQVSAISQWMIETFPALQSIG
ncbi:MAG TPA: cytochrome c biogenesis protein CcdA [Rhodobacteraceae bacterium]|nr:cytochrome c biogenesis protein CcdA [Paracoccaceae bacterium]